MVARRGVKGDGQVSTSSILVDGSASWWMMVPGFQWKLMSSVLDVFNMRCPRDLKMEILNREMRCRSCG